MRNVIIRKATYADIPQLITLRILYLYEKYGEKAEVGIDNLGVEIDRYFRKHLNHDVDVMVVELDGCIVGMFCICYLILIPGMFPFAERTAYLYFEYIKPEYREKDIISGLYDISIKSAKEKNATVFEKEVLETEFHLYEKAGFMKSPFPLVRMFLPAKCHYNNADNGYGEIVFRKASISDLSCLVNIRLQYLADTSGKIEVTSNKDLSERIRSYIGEYLNNRLEVFVAECNKVIVATIFIIYYARLPGLELPSGKAGVPVNFYVKPYYKAKNVLEALYEYAADNSFNNSVGLFDMTIPEKEMQFYEKLGFEQIAVKPIQLLI